MSMFIRTKNIKGQNYAYLVNNSWTEKGARQKVAKYLGKVHKPEKARQKGLKDFLGVQDVDQYIDGKQFHEIISDLVKLELHNHKSEDSFFVNSGQLKALNGKEAIVQANSGFICTETLKSLIEYKAENDDGYLLASLLTAAGLNVEKELFVQLFGKAKSQAPQIGEFYY